MRDTIYSDSVHPTPPQKFTFNEQVASVFDNMIERSVPLYRQTQKASASLAAEFLKVNHPSSHKKRVYDLGCSSGTTLIELCNHSDLDSVELIGIDNSSAMLERCRQKLKSHQLTKYVTLLQQDIATTSFLPCQVVFLNYTLQFISKPKRAPLLQKIYSTLDKGGILIMSEKTHFAHKEVHQHLTALHESFKSTQGYSQDEISRKRKALEDVLQTNTNQENLKMLTQAGFSTVEQFLQLYLFGSYIAIK